MIQIVSSQFPCLQTRITTKKDNFKNRKNLKGQYAKNSKQPFYYIKLGEHRDGIWIPAYSQSQDRTLN